MPTPPTTAQHTPGPWSVDKNGGKHNDQLVIVDSDDYVVCGTVGHFSSPRCLANARLIAAAPDLLAALQDLLVASEIIDGQESPPDSSDVAYFLKSAEQARLAIQRATA